MQGAEIRPGLTTGIKTEEDNADKQVENWSQPSHPYQ